MIARNEKQIAAALRRCREPAGLSQADLPTRMQARQGTVSRLETGTPTMQIRSQIEALTELNLELVIQPRSAAPDTGVEDLF